MTQDKIIQIVEAQNCKAVFSIPVGSTMSENQLQSVKDGLPVGEPVGPMPEVPQSALAALAQAAAALAAVLQSLAGQTPSCPSSLTPAHVAIVPDSLTLTELMNEFLRAKARAGKSDRYLRALRNSFSKFHAGRGRLPIASLSHADIEAWLARQKWSGRTVKGYVGDLRTLFNFAIRRGYLAKNPAAGIELPATVCPAPALHTPCQVAEVLEFARGRDPDLCRALAVRYFAGVRSAEVDRITEAEIRPGHIEVPAAKAKTRARRLVPISENLRAWLALGGTLPSTESRFKHFTAALKAHTGIDWPGNVCRHSFISYHLALYESAGKTALLAGTSEAMLFSHYRELATKAAAVEFWAICPK